MHKLIVIQFRTQKNTLAEEAAAFNDAFADAGVELVFKNAVLDALDWSAPARILGDARGVILGGSGEFDFDGGRTPHDANRHMSHALTQAMGGFLEFIEEHDYPMLGICFGHQLLARSKGVDVVNDKRQAKIGSHTISLTDEGKTDPLFRHLPENFIAQYGHKDSLSSLPSGAVLLARGERCAYSALRFGKRRYSLQFHPELDARRLIAKLDSLPDYLPQGFSPEKHVQESPHTQKILLNFADILAAI